MPQSLNTVIFDFGGVLTYTMDPARENTMADLCGFTVEQFHRAYPLNRLDLDRGSITHAEYWSRILATNRTPATPAVITQLCHEDTLCWLRENRAAIDWSAEIRSRGIKTAILSNMPPEILDYMHRSNQFRWIEDFEVRIFSCDVGLVKPEPTIYNLCIEQLGVARDECVFLDDKEVNVKAAQALGMESHLFYNIEEIKRLLEPRLREGIDARS